MNNTIRDSLFGLSTLIKDHLLSSLELDVDEAYAVISSSLKAQGDLSELLQDEEDGTWVEKSFTDFLRAFDLITLFHQVQTTNPKTTESIAESIAKNIVAICDELAKTPKIAVCSKKNIGDEPMGLLEKGLEELRSRLGSTSSLSDSSYSENESEWEEDGNAPAISSSVTSIQKHSGTVSTSAPGNSAPHVKNRIRIDQILSYTKSDDLTQTKDSGLFQKLASRKAAIEQDLALNQDLAQAKIHAQSVSPMPYQGRHFYATRQNTRAADLPGSGPAANASLQSDAFIQLLKKDNFGLKPTKTRETKEAHPNSKHNYSLRTRPHAQATWGAESPSSTPVTTPVSTASKTTRSSSASLSVDLNCTGSTVTPRTPIKTLDFHEEDSSPLGTNGSAHKRRKLSSGVALEVSFTSPAQSPIQTKTDTTPASSPFKVPSHTPTSMRRASGSERRSGVNAEPILFSPGLSPTSSRTTSVSTPASASRSVSSHSSSSISITSPAVTSPLTMTPRPELLTPPPAHSTPRVPTPTTPKAPTPVGTPKAATPKPGTPITTPKARTPKVATPKAATPKPPGTPEAVKAAREADARRTRALAARRRHGW